MTPSPQTRLLTSDEILKLQGEVMKLQSFYTLDEAQVKAVLQMVPALLADREELVSRLKIAQETLEALARPTGEEPVSEHNAALALSRIRSLTLP